MKPRTKKPNTAKSLSVPEQHQLRVARRTLKMHPAMAAVMGGPSHEQAREIIRQLTGKIVKEALISEGSRGFRQGMKRPSSNDRFAQWAKSLFRAGYKAEIGLSTGSKEASGSANRLMKQAKKPGMSLSKHTYGVKATNTMIGRGVGAAMSDAEGQRRELINRVHRAALIAKAKTAKAANEAYAPINRMPNLLGAFTERSHGKHFEFEPANDAWAAKHGLPHRIHVGGKETRFAKVGATVAHVAVDEGPDGKPVIEKWSIKSRWRKQ